MLDGTLEGDRIPQREGDIRNMSSLFGQVWFWSLFAFVVGAVLTWALLVRPAQQRAQQLEKQSRPNSRPTPRSGPAQQAPPRPGQPAGPPRTAYQQPPAAPPAWPGQQEQNPATAEHHERTRWLERDSLQGTGTPPAGAQPPEPPTQYARPEPYPEQQGFQRELEQQYPEDFEREYSQSYQPDYPEEDEQRYASGYEQSEFGGSHMLDHRQVADPQAGGLFQPLPPAEPEAGHGDNGHAAASDVAPAEAQPEEEAPDTDPVTGLPKRRRGATNRIRGGFAPPRPIEPSMRPVTRRTPQDSVSSSGSLFEPGQGEQQPPGSVAQASGQADAAEVPAGPFGPGSAMPLPGGGKPDPAFTVKASVTELRYCTEDSPQFAGMTPEVWFATPGDAERVGFRRVP